mgnify:CR=1 FL=1
MHSPSIELSTSPIHNTDDTIIANVITTNDVKHSISIATIATPEDIHTYSLEILDTEHATEHATEPHVEPPTEIELDNVIYQIIHNKQVRINVENSIPIHTFLHMRSRLFEYYTALFIVNLTYNICNIFNIVLFIPLFYYLFVLTYPKMIHLLIVPYCIIISIIINVCINIGITLNIYIVGLHYIKYITPVIHSSIIFYITLLYLCSLTNILLQCIFLRDIVYFKKNYRKLKTYILHEQRIHTTIIRNT